MLYNYQNKPERVNKADGSYVKYVYDGAGRKLRQEVYNAANALQKSTDYVGELLLENEAVQLVQTEEGRIVTPSAVAEYQYHLTDHQGNVRMTFTTKDEVETTTATLENSTMTTEQNQFLRYNNARRVYSLLFNHSNPGSALPGPPPDPDAPVSGYAQRLNGTSNEKYGLARSISVVPGDVISAEVYAKYLDPSSSNWTAALAAFISQVQGGTAPAGTVVDGSGYASSTPSFPFPGLRGADGQENTGPQGYLNWLVFDRHYNFIPGKSGFRRLSTASREYGQGVPHERLFTPSITVTEPGYVYIYLSNESPTMVEVYFDDFKVMHTKSPVVQSNDQYSFGSSISAFSYQRENSAQNKFLYNGGSELQTDVASDLYGTFFRGYDATIGRFQSTDILAEKYSSQSPYQFGFNQPTYFNDPVGDEPNSAGWQQIRQSRMDDMVARQQMQGMGVSGDDDMYGMMFGRGIGFASSSGFARFGPGDGGALAKIGDEFANRMAAIAEYKEGLKLIYGDNVSFNGGQSATVFEFSGTSYYSNYGQMKGGIEVTPVDIWMAGGKVQFSSSSSNDRSSSQADNSWRTPWHFLDGFLNPNLRSDAHITVSAQGAAIGLGYVAEVGRINSRIQANQATTWSRYANELRSVKAYSAAGRTLGVTGAAIPIVLTYFDGNRPSGGDWVKAGINTALVFAGPVGWIVLAVDVGTGLATGATISDRIGAGIDYSLKH